MSRIRNRIYGPYRSRGRPVYIRTLSLFTVGYGPYTLTLPPGSFSAEPYTEPYIYDPYIRNRIYPNRTLPPRSFSAEPSPETAYDAQPTLPPSTGIPDPYTGITDPYTGIPGTHPLPSPSSRSPPEFRIRPPEFRLRLAPRGWVRLVRRGVVVPLWRPIRA